MRAIGKMPRSARAKKTYARLQKARTLEMYIVAENGQTDADVVDDDDDDDDLWREKSINMRQEESIMPLPFPSRRKVGGVSNPESNTANYVLPNQHYIDQSDNQLGKQGLFAPIIRRRSGCCGATPSTLNVNVVNSSFLHYLQDWHHSLLNLSFHWLALFVFLVYNLLFVLFALLWSTIRFSCNFGDETTILDAYYFSIETMMTIGYSAPDAFFGECWSGIGVLMTESLMGVIMNSFTLTLLYQRLSRGQRRSNTVIFSKKAIVVVQNGKLQLRARICDIAPGATLIGATVRMFAVRDEFDVMNQTKFQCQLYPMHVDSAPLSSKHKFMGSTMRTDLIMCLPSVVTHTIDIQSPLHPKFQGLKSMIAAQAEQINDEQVLNERRAGEEKWNDVLQSPDCLPKDQINSGETENIFGLADEVIKSMKSHQTEVVLLLEAHEAYTSAAVQCQYSYRLDDINFHEDFQPCVYRDDTGTCTVNMKHFHNTRTNTTESTV